MGFHGLPAKACKDAPKPKSDKDDDDDSSKVKWDHKHGKKKDCD
jgi:hypothetical protein